MSVSKELDIDAIDMTYESGTTSTAFDVQDDSVRDRWSRYIGAMGIEAVKKQSTARVYLVGLGALGVEVAKNIVLSGVK